jgi:hypothetical protein
MKKTETVDKNNSLTVTLLESWNSKDAKASRGSIKLDNMNIGDEVKSG